jgi:serine/threonine protein kinase
MPEDGQVLRGKYQLERLVGRGGFASVWAAKNLLLDRRVALKILDQDQAARPGFLPRFLREAKLASRYIHENIVAVEDLDETPDGLVYLVMELLEGETLAALLKRRKFLPVDEAMAIMVPVLAGLAAAHELNIIHRDIKPANIFLTTDDSPGARVRLLDLGLAKDLVQEDGVTINEQMFGTPSYLAPEFFVGPGVRQWAASADVFACGMLLFRMLTGGLPFDRPVHQLPPVEQFLARGEFYRKIQGLPGPARFRPDIPARIDAVVRRAMALEPNHRYSCAGEVLDDLNRRETALTQTVAFDNTGDSSAPVAGGLDEAEAPHDTVENDDFEGGATVYDPEPYGLLVGEDIPETPDESLTVKADEPATESDGAGPTEGPPPLAGDGGNADRPLGQGTPRLGVLASGRTEAQWGPGNGSARPSLRRVTPMPGQLTRRRSVWWGPVVAGVVTFVVLSAGGTALLWHMRSRLPASSGPASVATEPVVSSLSLSPVGVDEPAADEESGAIRLEIVTVPAGATVLLDGEFIGTSPLQRSLPSSDGVRRLRLTAEGYLPTERELSLLRSQSLKIPLKPLPE